MKVVEDFHHSLGTMAGLFGIPELHSVPVMFATRTRVAQKEGMCWRGGCAATPAHPFLLCSRASPCEDNGRNGYTRKPWEQWAYFLTHLLRRGRVDKPDCTYYRGAGTPSGGWCAECSGEGTLVVAHLGLKKR